MTCQFRQTIPILRIFDYEKAKEFYVGFLGCAIDWEHRFEEGAPAYLQVSRGDLVIHLSEHHGDSTPGGAFFVWMTDVESFHAELIAKRYRHNRPGLEETFYGTKSVETIDPFGNRIRFNEPLPKQAAVSD